MSNKGISTEGEKKGIGEWWILEINPCIKAKMIIFDSWLLKNYLWWFFNTRKKVNAEKEIFVVLLICLNCILSSQKFACAEDAACRCWVDGCFCVHATPVGLAIPALIRGSLFQFIQHRTNSFRSFVSKWLRISFFLTKPDHFRIKHVIAL